MQTRSGGRIRGDFVERETVASPVRGEGTRRLGSPVTPLPFSARRRRAPAPPLAARQTSGPFPRGRGGLCALGPSAALAAALCLSGRLGRSFLTGQGPRAARSCLRELEERAASTVALCAPTRVSARCACLLLWREEGAPRPRYGDRRSPAKRSRSRAKRKKKCQFALFSAKV